MFCFEHGHEVHLANIILPVFIDRHHDLTHVLFSSWLGLRSLRLPEYPMELLVLFELLAGSGVRGVTMLIRLNVATGFKLSAIAVVRLHG